MRSILDKKGQVGKLQGIVFALLLIGLILGVGFLVLEEFKGTMDNTANSVAMEEITITTAGGLGGMADYNVSSVQCFNSFAVTNVTNGSGVYTLVATSNYSYDSATGRIYNTSTLWHGDTLWNVSYTYYSGSDACNAVDTTITATQKIPTWLSIIVILLIVAALLAVIFKVIIPVTSGERGTMAEI